MVIRSVPRMSAGTRGSRSSFNLQAYLRLSMPTGKMAVTVIKLRGELMIKSSCCLVSIFLLLSSPVCAQGRGSSMVNSMKILKIDWQRLLTDGKTCSRCGATEQEVERASRNLEKSLAPLGIKVVLEKREITPEAFQKDPSRSNSILLNGRPLEEWLGLKVGQSPCCGPCGDAECRTLESRGQVYETIPAELIIQGGLRAASQLVNPQAENPCCPKDSKGKGTTPPCCPK
jgi:hypothetical protein